MTSLEELRLIHTLIKKHNLPFSPILEYAIKEREQQYIDAERLKENVTMTCESQLEFAVNKKLEDYGKEFVNLSVGVVGGHKLPHKAILLMSVMHLIETGVIDENEILLDKSVSNAFVSIWKKFYDKSKVPSVWIPFWYMKSEPFWHFKAAGNEDVLNALLSFAGHPSVGQMRPVIKYAYLDKALFDYMENDGSREKLREVLIKTYIEL